MVEKSLYIRDICEGATIDSPFVLDSAELRDRRGGKYIMVTLSDCTGRLTCKVWGTQGSSPDEIEELYRMLRQGEVYRIRGFAKVFNGNCEINVNDGISHMAAPVPLSDVNVSDYVYAPVDRREIAARLQDAIASITDGGLQALVRAAFADTEGFYEVPAAKRKHHDYAGGLAEHTLETARIAVAIARSVARAGMNRDLLLAGGLLHDIGKAFCFERRGISFAARPEYDLIGHTTLGMNHLSRYRTSIDPAAFCHLLHIVQSHHGPYGEVLPQTPEAWAVHFADNASARIREVSDDIEQLAPGEGTWRGSRSGDPVYRFP
ncbi:MAG: HD domain-containing protein [Methanomicrobiaceae archaeon]|uniref:Mptb, dihydroneopterin 2, 3-cyclic phosphate phosphodiesterase n=1 Tax=hydrocarbon metagenome TaxID=938273 RepID=A0A0W8FK18_9ZZZZ|nr:HD domain-containing protein [Methanomicrobiaceae archaeon]MDD5419674.1 HD domain-containing protein [Methanomicrobiaceae archaeon]